MSIETKRAMDGWKLLAVAGLLASNQVMAEYVPFPGKLRVTVVSVNSPTEVVVNYETWPGFRRNTTIDLPGIVVPVDTPRASACERELAARATVFAKDFVEGAKKVYVQDMRMETSADETALSDILTDHGSLTQALKDEGLARADSVPADTPWCQ